MNVSYEEKECSSKLWLWVFVTRDYNECVIPKLSPGSDTHHLAPAVPAAVDAKRAKRKESHDSVFKVSPGFFNLVVVLE